MRVFHVSYVAVLFGERTYNGWNAVTSSEKKCRKLHVARAVFEPTTEIIDHIRVVSVFDRWAKHKKMTASLNVG